MRYGLKQPDRRCRRFCCSLAGPRGFGGLLREIPSGAGKPGGFIGSFACLVRKFLQTALAGRWAPVILVLEVVSLFLGIRTRLCLRLVLALALRCFRLFLGLCRFAFSTPFLALAFTLLHNFLICIRQLLKIPRIAAFVRVHHHRCFPVCLPDLPVGCIRADTQDDIRRLFMQSGDFVHHFRFEAHQPQNILIKKLVDPGQLVRGQLSRFLRQIPFVQQQLIRNQIIATHPITSLDVGALVARRHSSLLHIAAFPALCADNFHEHIHLQIRPLIPASVRMQTQALLAKCQRNVIIGHQQLIGIESNRAVCAGQGFFRAGSKHIRQEPIAVDPTTNNSAQSTTQQRLRWLPLQV
mmetsp:Transcript_49114/g.106971  ORF Transcript_49114/g.106971 Transcript_49114/m.106971 type:complete len:353 (+) Transcript_49114:1246-2304(+)